ARLAAAAAERVAEILAEERAAEPGRAFDPAASAAAFRELAAGYRLDGMRLGL
ncbi:MAG: hypothetical protein RLZZ440_1288, partial [Planctomycetota bacterium]